VIGEVRTMHRSLELVDERSGRVERVLVDAEVDPATLTAALQETRAICTIPGHAASGMKGTFRVS
jgi:uncharacterized cupredoxin-like copper-binding protein